MHAAIRACLSCFRLPATLTDRLAEILQSKQTTEKGAQETANSLHALVVGGGKKKTPVSAGAVVHACA